MADVMDFDDLLLAEAEQEEEMYDDYMDDIEAEMAIEAEASTRTPSNGGSGSAPGIGVATQAAPAAGFFGGAISAAAAAPAETVAPPSPRNNCPSPTPLEQRLGVSPLDEDSPTGGPHAGEAMRALNREGFSPLHPVLKDENSDSRWGLRLSAAKTDRGALKTRATRSSRSSKATSNFPDPTSASAMTTALSSRGGTAARVDTRGVVLSRPSMDGDSVPFMQSGGRMMHLRVRRASSTTNTTTSAASVSEDLDLTSPPPAGNLLRTPLATLMERVTERRVVERSLATAAKEREAATAAAAERDDVEGGGGAEESGSVAVKGKRKGNGDGSGGGGGSGSEGKGRVGFGGSLWVDKYAPESFRDLLSDERVNREVLGAVKAWDRFVFKKEPASQKDSAPNAAGKPRAGQLHTTEGEASDKRPEARVIMLCGPPGLGKTTLANVVARHAGYRVYEINASDDRTAPVLKQRITEAMEGSTLLTDKRPNLIVLDEVDGADGKAAAQVLADFATAPLAKKARGGGAGGGGGKKTKRRALTRPLVLICNDQWTPALRPIRAIAQVFVFRNKSSPTRLVQRLKAICTAERLPVNTDALTRLADQSHLDVRSCLNTLQFVARRAASGGVRNASSALLTAVAEGVKDERRDLFEVLRSVFTRRKSGAKRRLFIGGEQGAPGVYVGDRKEADVFEEVQTFNDHGKILAGVHENFLAVRFNDPTLAKAAAAMDWLEMADLMDARTHLTQDYSFSRYSPLAAAGVHYLCRSDQRVAVSQPKKDYESRTARVAKNNILRSFADGRQLASTGRATQAVVLDMLSHLMDIVAPTLRPLNPDLLSPQERARFRDLVEILLSCGLTFAPQSASGGGLGGAQAPYGSGGAFPGAVTQEFALEPAIDQLLKYKGYDLAHPILAAPLRPMVAHEVNLEAMRQAEASKQSQDEADTAATAAEGPFAALSFSTQSPGDTGRLSPVASSKERPTDQRTLFPLEKGTRKPSTYGADAPAGSSGGPSGNEKEKLAHDKPNSTTMATADNRKRGEAGASKEELPDRPAHVVPFWNRTNWIAGREDGTGVRGAGRTKDATATAKGSGAPSKGGDTGSAQGTAGGGNGSGGRADAKRPREERGCGDGGRGGVEAKKLSVRYQFRAGYTNAVRRPVRMRDLM